jgi:hypothetical protein
LAVPPWNRRRWDETAIQHRLFQAGALPAEGRAAVEQAALG